MSIVDGIPFHFYEHIKTNIVVDTMNIGKRDNNNLIKSGNEQGKENAKNKFPKKRVRFADQNDIQDFDNLRSDGGNIGNLELNKSASSICSSRSNTTNNNYYNTNKDFINSDIIKDASVGHNDMMKGDMFFYKSEGNRIDENNNIQVNNIPPKEKANETNDIREPLSNNAKGNNNSEKLVNKQKIEKQKDMRRPINNVEGKTKELVELRNMDLCYENKYEKLNTIKEMDGKKKMFKLILEDVDLSPDEVMRHVLALLKRTTKLNTKIKIHDTTYKIKYRELPPEDRILFSDEVKNIINCRYIYIGVLTVSKCVDEIKLDEKDFQKWQMDDFF